MADKTSKQQQCESCSFSELAVTSPFGSIKGISSQTLGTICLAIMGGFLIYQLSVGVTGRLDKLIEAQNRSTTQIERVIDRLDKTGNQVSRQ